jgi:predicted O-methyltransferase YrrM
MIPFLGGWKPGPKRAFSQPGMREEVKRAALDAKGFLSEQEGIKLFELARQSAGRAPCLEIGSYCGKSTIFLAEGCRAAGGHALYAVDHHRGSEEQQPGQQYFDPTLFDPALERPNTLPTFLGNLERTGLREWVIPVVTESARFAANWTGGLSLVFIDGGHGRQDVERDLRLWGQHVIKGGWLCFHDVYPNPADGGQAPYEVFEIARAAREWRFEGLFGSLGVLERR